jgi:hypothetical protein
VLIGRGVLKKEEKESCEDEAEEAVDKHEKKMHGKKGEVAKHEKTMHKEDTEQLQEYQSKDGVYKHKGTYGGEKGAEYGETDWDKENKDAKKLTKPKASRKLGARQNYVRSSRVNESFTNMIAAYQEKGLKALAEMSSVEEEVDSETYETEMKDQKDKFDGKKKGGDVAKASVQAVKQEEVELDEAEKMKGEDPCWKNYEMVGMKNKNGRKVPNCVPKNEEYEVIDANDVNGVTIDTIEEDAEQLDELSNKTIQSYHTKATGIRKGAGNIDDKMVHHSYAADDANETGKKSLSRYHDKKFKDLDTRYRKRGSGIDRAEKRLGINTPTVEEVELEERSLTEPEAKKKEDYVKGMKKKLSSFKDRYGDRAKEVIYATATNMAKKD